MNIDLTSLITNKEKRLTLDIKVNYEKEKLKKTNIRELKNVTFNGEIIKLYNDDYQISGLLKGKMILPDDVTLEDTEINFQSNINEKIKDYNSNNDTILKIIQNKLDISEFLWQNILVEIPLKVINKKNENLNLNGNGWRLITEEELKDNNNSPFKELQEKFQKGGVK